MWQNKSERFAVSTGSIDELMFICTKRNTCTATCSERDTAHHQPQTQYPRIESIWSDHLLYLLHHDPERETSHLRLHGYGMLRARLREVARRIQTRTRHRSRRNHTRWKILIGLPALRRCLRTGSGSDDWRESVRKIATDRCEEDYRGVGMSGIKSGCFEKSRQPLSNIFLTTNKSGRADSNSVIPFESIHAFRRASSTTRSTSPYNYQLENNSL